MRALIAAPFYPPHPGGIERYSAGVAAELRRRGWEVDVLHSVTDADPAPPATGPAGETLLALDARLAAGRLPIPLPGARNAEISRRLRAAHYDFTLIQSHLFVSNLMAARAARGRHAVWLNHGSGHIPTGNPVSDKLVAAYEHALAGRLRRLVPTVAAVSAEAAAWLTHLRVTTDASVGNAVASVSPPRGERLDGPLRVVYVGRLEPGKGALEAIRMVDALPAEAPVALTICGDGSVAGEVERAARASRKDVVTTGALPHEKVQEYLADADVFVYPSTYPEGFPTVLLEAGAAGCAVLTYELGGAKELLAEGGGWRVSGTGEAEQVLADLALRPALATEAGEALRRTVQSTYTWQSVVDRLLRLGGVSE